MVSAVLDQITNRNVSGFSATEGDRKTNDCARSRCFQHVNVKHKNGYETLQGKVS